MATAPKVPTVPVLRCECGKSIEIPGRRIGDSVTCPGCGKGRVVLRSKVEGDVLPAVGAQAISDRLPEVQVSLKRIRLRKAGHAARGVALYPQWTVFALGVFGFYLATILAGQNLRAVGFPERGRRLQVLGVSLYVILGAASIAAWVRWGDAIPGTPLLRLLLVLGITLAVSTYAALAGRAQVAAAFEAGAQPASAIVPALLGFLLAVAQLFLVKFADVAAGW